MFRVSEFWAHSFIAAFSLIIKTTADFFEDCIKVSQFISQCSAHERRRPAEQAFCFKSATLPYLDSVNLSPIFFLNRPNSRSVESPNRSHSKIRSAYAELTSWCCVIGLPVNSSYTPVSFAIAPSAKKSSKMAEARVFFVKRP